MPTLYLETHIQTVPDRVFDLARSIDLHQWSASQTHEKAVGGRTSGLIGLHESVTWRARHLGVYQRLTAHITAYDRPHHFTDEQLRGAFKSFTHQHRFEALPDGSTRMIDEFRYTAPLGWLGKLADWLFLKAYMRRFLEQRNAVIKAVAESDRWKDILPETEAPKR
jgi:ligand-binding SRPBCC domain-containing protein